MYVLINGKHCAAGNHLGQVSDYNRVPTLFLTKIQDFSRTFQDPHEKFSRTFSERMNASI